MPHPFSGLSDVEQASVLAGVRPQRFAAGDLVFVEGEPGACLHVLEAGHVMVRRADRDGGTVTLAVLGAGDCFGELGLLVTHSRRTADVVALDEVRTRVLTRGDLDRLRQRLPHLDRGLLRVVVGQVERLSEQVLELTHLPVDVASMAGVSRPTVNRLLKRWEADGILQLRRGRTVVLDPDRLAPPLVAGSRTC